jgi:hypothetical protein
VPIAASGIDIHESALGIALSTVERAPGYNHTTTFSKSRYPFAQTRSSGRCSCRVVHCFRLYRVLCQRPTLGSSHIISAHLSSKAAPLHSFTFLEHLKPKAALAVCNSNRASTVQAGQRLCYFRNTLEHRPPSSILPPSNNPTQPPSLTSLTPLYQERDLFTQAGLTTRCALEAGRATSRRPAADPSVCPSFRPPLPSRSDRVLQLDRTSWIYNAAAHPLRAPIPII